MNIKEIARATAAIALGVSSLMAVVSGANAQTFPTRPIVFICGFPAGVGSDSVVRFLASTVQNVSGHRVIVENKPGGGGIIAAESLIRSKPDGHTVLVHAPVIISNVEAMFAKPAFNPRTAVEVASTFIDGLAFFVAVDAKSEIKSLAQLTAQLKGLGDRGLYGSVAVSSKIVGEAYKASLGLQAVEVPYKVPPESINDLLSGNLHFISLDPLLSFVESRKGRVRLLATSSGSRLSSMPDIPTLKESGVDIDLTGWFAAMVPAGTDTAAKAKLNEWIQKSIRLPEAEKLIANIGSTPYIATPEEGQKRMLREIDDWANYAKLARITPQ